MAADRRRWGNRVSGRRLRFEPLEDRSLLSAASPGQPVIGDNVGNLFAVNIGGATPLVSLGTMDQVMLDIDYTPAGTLLGVGDITTEDDLATSGLFAIPANLESPTTDVKTILLGAVTYNNNGVTLNSLEVRSDGTVFAAGTYSDHGYLFILSAGTGSTVKASIAADLEVNESVGKPAGDLAFDSSGNLYLTTLGDNGHLLKINSSLTTVTDVGRTGYKDFFGLTFSGSTLLGYREGGEVYSLNTSNATISPVTTLSGDDLAGIYGAALVPSSPLSIGQVDFRTLTAEYAYCGNMAYTFTAAHDGLLTVELVDTASDADFDLYRLGSSGSQTLVGSDSGTRTDLTVAAGQAYVLVLTSAPTTFDLRLTNLVSVSGDTTTVYGTTGNDTFTFTAGSPYSFTINDVSYPYDSVPGQTDVVAFYGGSGTNTANLTGGASAGTVTFNLGSSSGSYVTSGLEVDLYNAGITTYTGAGASDTASLTGTSHIDTITLGPQSAKIAYGSSYVQVSGVPTISVDGGGSSDTATFTGGTAALTAAVNFRQADITANDASYAIHVANTKTIVAKAGSSGADVGTIVGSTSTDSLVGTPAAVTMFATNFYSACNGFSSVQAYGNGGNDVAQLSDAGVSGTTVFNATPTQATLSGAGYSIQVNQFSTVTAKRVSGSYGTANLYGSSGNDVLTSTPTWAKLVDSASTFSLRANAFNSVYAYSNGGSDLAVMHGSSGDDTFIGRPGDSALSGAGWSVRAKAFRQVYAYGEGSGADKAFLYDSAGADALVASGKVANLSSSTYPYVNQASNFGEVTVIFTSGTNTKKIGSISYVLTIRYL